MYFNVLDPLFYFSAMHLYFCLTVQIKPQRHHWIRRLRLILWIEIRPIYRYPVTYFGNPLNTMIKLPILLMVHGRILYYWTLIEIHGTSLILIFVQNLMGVGKMDRNLHVMLFVHTKLPIQPEIQRSQKICPP